MMAKATWGVDGYDTFEGGDAYYNVTKGLATEAEARAAASEYLRKIEAHQPSEHSGGQDPYGIQDRVFIVRPDGPRERVVSELGSRPQAIRRSTTHLQRRRTSAASEPPERSEPAKRRASDGVGESEGRSPSDKARNTASTPVG